MAGRQDSRRLVTVLEQIARDERITAVAACDPSAATIATTHGFPRQFACSSIARRERTEQPAADGGGDFSDEIIADLREAVAELAREGTSSAAGAWSPQRLQATLERSLHGDGVVVLANREPYIHDRGADGAVRILHPASGLVTALEPVMRACSGTWVAHGSGTADRENVDEHDRLLVPPGEGAYALRRVWLSREEEAGYYYGFSNEGLWPLCHIAHARPVFRADDWHHYRVANERFADAGCREVRSHHEPPEVFRFLRAADVCYVSSLHDGMNLVAKEFVAARDDERGVLVLSRFTGAARELTEALIVNPYDLEQASAALATALSMPAAEQADRMRTMRALVAELNVYRWAGKMLQDAARVRQHGRLSDRLAMGIRSVTGGGRETDPRA